MSPDSAIHKPFASLINLAVESLVINTEPQRLIPLGTVFKIEFDRLMLERRPLGGEVRIAPAPWNAFENLSLLMTACSQFNRGCDGSLLQMLDAGHLLPRTARRR